MDILQVLKMYAWEPSFSSKVQAVRRKELSYIQRQAFLTMVVDASFISSPYLVGGCRYEGGRKNSIS